MISALRVSPARLGVLLLAGAMCMASIASRQTAARAEGDTPIPPSLTTPDQVETSIGTLKFRDGIPDQATAGKVYDQLDFQRGVSAFLNGLRGVSIYAARQGIRDAGVKDNEGVLIFSGLMDSRSLFLTANADTVYFLANIDLTKGPMVVETPPDSLGLFDDLWFRWVIDFGAPGPDRGMGGKYLLLPPGYDGPLPDGGYFIGRPTTTSVALLGRSFLVNNDPKPTVETIKKTLKIYPYVPGSYGTSMGTFLTGKGPLAPLSKPGTLTFVEGTGVAMNTIPPNDFSYYEMLNALVQEQPAEALQPEIGGQFAAIGIVKGKPFNPDARMRKILTDAIAVANAAARTVCLHPARIRGLRLLQPDVEMAEPAVRQRLRIHASAAGGHQGGREAVSVYRRPHARCAYRLLLCRHRRDAGDDHADTGSRIAISVRHNGLRRRSVRWRQDLQGDAAAEHPGGEVLVVHALRQPDALDAADAAALPARRQPELSEPGGRGERRRLDHRLFWPEQARRRQGRQFHPDRCPERAGS